GKTLSTRNRHSCFCRATLLSDTGSHRGSGRAAMMSSIVDTPFLGLPSFAPASPAEPPPALGLTTPPPEKSVRMDERRTGGELALFRFHEAPSALGEHLRHRSVDAGGGRRCIALQES